MIRKNPSYVRPLILLKCMGNRTNTKKKKKKKGRKRKNKENQVPEIALLKLPYHGLMLKSKELINHKKKTSFDRNYF